MPAQNSPIDRLPQEILAYIFVLGAWNDPSDSDEHEYQREDTTVDISLCTSYSYTFPCVVAAVSRRWRAVALSTGALWSKISITVEDILDIPGSNGECFDVARMFLSRSRNFPLDILLDARDPDWDFSEHDPSTAGSTPAFDCDFMDDYRHPFSLTHMQAALDLIYPHLRHSRSLAILTDRWAPMHLALSRLSVDDTAPQSEVSLAPRLQSLVLMRCNEFAGYGPEFTPPEFAQHRFVPFGGCVDGTALPHLQQLILSGVHLDWSSLASLLPLASGLRLLELSYHCSAVRPRIAEFRKFLGRCPQLQELSIKVSGPLVEGKLEHQKIDCDGDLISMPRLRKLTLGYDDSQTTLELLRSLEAPNLRVFVLEDASPPTAEHDQDGGIVLKHCARPAVADPNGTDIDSPHVVLRPVFPMLQSVDLHGVKASTKSFQMFFTSLSNLQSLTLSHTPVCAINALRPSRPHDAIAFCPCPHLDRLLVKGFELAMDPSLLEILRQRTDYGAIVRDVRLELKDGQVPGSSEAIEVGNLDEFRNVEIARASPPSWRRDNSQMGPLNIQEPLVCEVVCREIPSTGH